MILEADRSSIDVLTEMSCLLWKDAKPAELYKEYDGAMSCGDNAFFIKYANGEAAGFAHCSLRREYTEGVTSSPAGYLEAVFVKEKYRRKGFARELVAAAEDWARSKGCAEFASDCETVNAASIAFHEAIGFTEAGRIVCFVKKLRVERLQH